MLAGVVGAVLWPAPFEPQAIAVATVALAWIQAVIWGSYFYSLWDIDRRFSVQDAETERRGRIGKRVTVYALALFAATVCAIFLRDVW
jgi:hypothetical protein